LDLQVAVTPKESGSESRDVADLFFACGTIRKILKKLLASLVGGLVKSECNQTQSNSSVDHLRSLEKKFVVGLDGKSGECSAFNTLGNNGLAI
jgi:hypothetical protein